MGPGTIAIRQVFACEKIKRKRQLILHDRSMDHCFGDVEDFEKKEGFCYRCHRVHGISRLNCQIDILMSGPSCKDVSRLNINRAKHAGCYKDPKSGKKKNSAEPGTSGSTYKAGFKQAGCASPSSPHTQIYIYIYIIYIYRLYTALFCL